MLSPAPEEASASEESDGDSDEDNKLALQADAEKEAEPEAEAEAVTKKDKKKGKRIRKPKSKQKSEDEVPPPPAVQPSRADDPSSTAKLSQDDAPSSPAQQTPIAVLMEFFPNQPRHVLEEVLVKNSGDISAAIRAGLELPPVAARLARLSFAEKTRALEGASQGLFSEAEREEAVSAEAIAEFAEKKSTFASVAGHQLQQSLRHLRGLLVSTRDLVEELDGVKASQELQAQERV